MASVLLKASKLAPISARTLLQASRSGIILPRYVVQSNSVRWATAAAAQKTETVEEDAGTRARPSTSRATDSKNEDHAAIEEDQPTFLDIGGPVQAAVLPMLPELTKPYDPNVPPEVAGKNPRDLLVKARTGTGKTVAFLVPAIETRLADIRRFAEKAKKDAGSTDPKFELRARRTFGREQAGALIISPTRELATQIAVEATRLTKHHPELQVHLLVGGESKRQQVRHWMETTRDIVVATPGRIRDMLENEPDVAGPLSKANMLILDEADTLLEMGFREDIEAIAREMPSPPQRQTFMFSATVSRAIQQVARATLDKNHVFINCVSDDAPPVHAHVPQYHTLLPSAAEQIPHILRLLIHDQLTNPGKSKTLIFLPTTKMTMLFGTLLLELRKSLPNAGTRVYEIHSKRPQNVRTRMSDNFRNDKSGASILVSSDVSARGVDYPGVTRIIQVGVPASGEQYVHRVGRTGRGTEKSGRADLVLLPWEMGFVTWQLTDIPLKPLTVNELTSQVKELTEKHDAQPNSPARFTHPYVPKLNLIDGQIKDLIENVDEDSVKETMASMLGYYTSRSGELRVQKSVIVAGLKAWTTEACGLARPPYVSEAFLAKLGALDNRSSSSRAPRNYRRFDDKKRGDQPQWAGRGRRNDTPDENEGSGGYGFQRRRGEESSRSPREQRAPRQQSAWFMRNRDQ